MHRTGARAERMTQLSVTRENPRKPKLKNPAMHISDLEKMPSLRINQTIPKLRQTILATDQSGIATWPTARQQAIVTADDSPQQGQESPADKFLTNRQFTHASITKKVDSVPALPRWIQTRNIIMHQDIPPCQDPQSLKKPTPKPWPRPISLQARNRNPNWAHMQWHPWPMPLHMQRRVEKGRRQDYSRQGAMRYLNGDGANLRGFEEGLVANGLRGSWRQGS